MQKQSSIEQNEYQKSLDEGLPPPALSAETVRYWSDFNRVFYSPKSIVQLNDFELNSQLMPFERWDVGEELFGNLDREHDLLDRDLRPFAEECDQLQALQIIATVDDAWGGFAARYMDKIRDEFGKTSVWVWALEDGKRGQRVRHSIRNKSILLYGELHICVDPVLTLDFKLIRPVGNTATKSYQCSTFDPRSFRTSVSVHPTTRSTSSAAVLHHT